MDEHFISARYIIIIHGLRKGRVYRIPRRKGFGKKEMVAPCGINFHNISTIRSIYNSSRNM
jgi:hypothetical protein